jgi:hypothetical protein
VRVSSKATRFTAPFLWSSHSALRPWNLFNKGQVAKERALRRPQSIRLSARPAGRAIQAHDEFTLHRADAHIENDGNDEGLFVSRVELGYLARAIPKLSWVLIGPSFCCLDRLFIVLAIQDYGGR